MLKCSTRSDKTAEHCSGEGIIHIGENTVLCEQCFRNYAKKRYDIETEGKKIDEIVMLWRIARSEEKTQNTKIQGRKVSAEENYLDPVTYVPSHAEGNANHKDCQRGVIISVKPSGIFVLYCSTRVTQLTNPDNLVWG